MPLRIRTLDQLEAAHTVLQSPETGTPEQRAEIEAEMQRLAPVIELGLTDVTDYGIKFSKIDREDQELVWALQRARIEKARGSQFAPLSVAPRGLIESGLNIAQAVTDLVGWDGAGEFLGDTADEVRQNGIDLALDRHARALGRDLTASERRQTIRNAEMAMSGVGIGGEIAAGFASGGATLGARGLLSGIALGATEGGVFTYLTSKSEGETAEERRADRLGDAAWGSLLGGGVGTLTGATASVRNIVANQLRANGAKQDELFKLADEFGVRLDLGQASGSPVIQGIEARLRGDNLQKLVAEQSDELAQAFSNKLKFGLPRIRSNIGAELPGKTREAFAIYDDLVSSMKQRGQAAWTKSVNKAKEVSDPSELVMLESGLRGLEGRIDNIYGQLQKKFGGSVQAGPNLIRVRTKIRTMIDRGGATVDEVDDLWQAINTMANDPAKAGFVINQGEKAMDAIETMAGMLRRGLMRSIDEAPTSEAMGILRKGREVWGSNQKALQELTEEVMEPLGFGANRKAVEYLRALDNVDVSAMRQAVERLRKLPGGHARIRQMQSALFEGAVTDALDAAARKGLQEGTMDIGTFIDNLRRVEGRSRMAGLLSDTQEATMAEGLKLARAILNEPAAKSGNVIHRMVAGAEELAINVVSRDPGFMARLLAGAIARGKGADWLFFSEEGVKVLRRIQPGVLKHKGLAGQRNAAIALLTGMLNDGAANAQEDEVRARMEQGQ